MVRFLTAGESHGRALIVILEGIPAGLPIDVDAITADLKRRQGGYGRGRRMAIESDRAEILSGVRAGRNHRRADCHVDRESRLGQLAAHDADDHRASARCRWGAARAGDPSAARVTPISPAWPSTAAPMSATSSSAPARARPRRASPPGAVARQLLRRAGIRITSHVFSIGAGAAARGHDRHASTTRPR